MGDVCILHAKMGLLKFHESIQSIVLVLEPLALCSIDSPGNFFAISKEMLRADASSLCLAKQVTIDLETCERKTGGSGVMVSVLFPATLLHVWHKHPDVKFPLLSMLLDATVRF